MVVPKTVKAIEGRSTSKREKDKEANTAFHLLAPPVFVFPNTQGAVDSV